MKKKIGIVILCIVMFCLGCAVTGAIWAKDTAELEQTIADMNTQILDLNAEIVLHDVDMKKLEYLYGIDVEELLGE